MASDQGPWGNWPTEWQARMSSSAQQEAGTPTINSVAAQLAQFGARQHILGPQQQAYPGPHLSPEAIALLSIPEMSYHLRMLQGGMTTSPVVSSQTRSSSGCNTISDLSHQRHSYSAPSTSGFNPHMAVGGYAQQHQQRQQQQYGQQHQQQPLWPQPTRALPDVPGPVVSYLLQQSGSGSLQSSLQQAHQPGAGIRSFAAYEARYGSACRCDTGACAHEAELPCAAHRCVCCKVGRQVVQYSRQAWCGPCGKREVVAGLKFVRCGRCQSEMLAEMLPAHLKQNVAILDGEGKKVTGRCMGSTREVVTTDKGRRCGKCTNMRPVTFFSTDDANCTCNMHTIGRQQSPPLAAPVPVPVPVPAALTSQASTGRSASASEALLQSVVTAPSIIQANLVLDSARSALSSLCHASTALTSVIQLCQEVIQGTTQSPDLRLRDSPADQVSDLSSQLESGARALDACFQLFSAVTAKPQPDQPASQSSSLPLQHSLPTHNSVPSATPSADLHSLAAVQGTFSTQGTEATTTTSSGLKRHPSLVPPPLTFTGPPLTFTGSVGLPNTPNTAGGLSAMISGVCPSPGMEEGGASLCAWQLAAAAVLPSPSAMLPDMMLDPIARQLRDFRESLDGRSPMLLQPLMDAEPQPPPILPGGGEPSADRVAKRGWVEGEEAAGDDGDGDDGDADEQQLKRWRF